jgi:Rieske Fe-S protein
MAGGLLAGYGGLALIAGRFLYPSGGRKLAWVFVIEVERMKPGEVLRYRTPAGQMVTLRRHQQTGTVADFLALSSVCPHLGCQVHWEAQNDRFFCPCHNGAFDPSGKGIAGPPAEAGQSLSHYPVKIENGLLFIEVPLEALG